MLDLIHTYYRYTNWGNLKILETAARLSDEQYNQKCDVSFGSVHGILVHTIAVQWLWLRRWQGNSPNALPKPEEFAGLAALREYHSQIESETQAYLAALTETQVNAPLTYVNMKGREWTYPLWQLMLHQANHATQHRSEVAFITSQWAISPGGMDFLVFMDESWK
jgi:uncharacterized damage-inducible protein DinB